MGYLRGSHVPAAPIPTPRISPISFIPGLCGQPVLFSRDLRQIFQHQHSSSHVYTPIQNERSLHTQQIHLADCASHQRRSVLQTFRKIHPLDTIFETIMDIPLFETHNFLRIPAVFEAPRKLCLLEILLLHNSTFFLCKSCCFPTPEKTWTTFRMGLKWVFLRWFLDALGWV